MKRDIVKQSVWNLRAARQEKRFWRKQKRPFHKMILMAVYCTEVVLLKHCLDNTIDTLTKLLPTDHEMYPLEQSY